VTTRASARFAVIKRHLGRRDGYVGDFISELTRGRPGNVRVDRGATAVEYGLMVGLIAIVIVVAVAAFGHNVSQLFLVPASAFTP